jgi:hypothetical protein
MRNIPNRSVMLTSSPSSSEVPLSGSSSSTTTDLPVATRRWRRIRIGKDPTNPGHTASSTTGPRNRLRRYIVVSSTVLLIAYSTLVVKVPFVNGRARPGRSSSGGSTILASVDIFRLAQRPWGSVYQRKRHRRRAAIDTVQNQGGHHQKTAGFDSSAYQTLHNFTIQYIDNKEEPWNRELASSILYHHKYSRYHSKVAKTLFQRRNRRSKSSTRFCMTKKVNCLVGPTMVEGAFINDWACIPRGGDVAEKSDIKSSTTLSTSTLNDPASVIVDDWSTKEVSDERLNDSESDQSFDDAENESTDSTIQSSHTSMENTQSVTNEISDSDDDSTSTNITSKYSFSFYQKGDGSEDDVDNIPIRYLRMQNDNRERAKHAVEETLKWRALNNVDSIIGIAHPDYDVCKATFPHFFLDYSYDNTVIFIQRPALLNLELAKKNGLTNQALLSKLTDVGINRNWLVS